MSATTRLHSYSVLTFSLLVSLISLGSHPVKALSAASKSKVATQFPTVPLASVDTTQLAVWDGAEWASVRHMLQQDGIISEKEYPSSTKCGYMTVVVGRNENGQRVVAMKSADGQVYQDSVAALPDSISNGDALSTYITSISAVHAVLPKAERVGGSEDSVVGGKVVVVGGNDLACFAAESLTSLGVDVCLVSSGNPKVTTSPHSIGTLEIVKPAVGPSGTGFSSHVGTFDALLDTIGNERPLENAPVRQAVSAAAEMEDSEFYDLESTPANYPSAMEPLGSSTSILGLLRSRHKCHTYVSTQTHCQSLVAKEGILGGPRQADGYAQELSQKATQEGQAIPPPAELGPTMEILFQKGVIFSQKTKEKLHQKSKSVRGWSLTDFWEQSTWPRDSSGSAQIRFGLPVIEDLDLYLEPMIAEAPYRPGGPTRKSKFSKEDFDPKEQYLEDMPPKPVQNNPFVRKVAGVQGIQVEIMEEELDCIIFLSAKFCKTCRSINPQYTRMARISKEEKESTIFFAKAEASGRWGKELGKYLEVDAVPAFVLFRKGERYGSALSVSRLPSRQINRALRLLESGAEWDAAVLLEDEGKP